MIKGGNYHYLDFDAHREKILDILIKYHGKEHEENIRRRMEKVTYVPYTRYDNVIDYYSESMTQRSDEIYSAFENLTGLTLSDEQKHAIWREGGSRLFVSNFEGDNLDDCEVFLGKEYCDEIRKAREEVCQLFNITAENPVPEFQKLCRTLKKALRQVADAHPCDVYKDVEKFINNKNSLLQKYLTFVSKYYLSMTDRDIDIINNPDFDSYDVDNLDCRYMFFEDTIGKPGLVYFFTSETQELFNNGTLDDQIAVLVGRTKWFALNGGGESLKYVTADEIFGRTEVANKEDYLERLIKELEHQVINQPEATMTMEDADSIERNRKFLAETQYYGCRFAQNINKMWDGYAHTTSSEDQWMTTMGYYGNCVDIPQNFIFFNEDTRYAPKELLGNLLHEVEHAMSFGNAFISRDGKKAYGRYGLAGKLLGIDSEHVTTESIEYPNYEGLLSIEENLNERYGKDLTRMFRGKYGDIFEERDIPTKANLDFTCAYDYWNFLTNRFYEEFGERIKSARLMDEQNIFFDTDGIPATTKKEDIMEHVRANIRKRTNPHEYQDRGFLSYSKLVKLAKVIEQYRANVMPLLEEGIMPKELELRCGENYDKLAFNTKLVLEKLENAANGIVDDMVKDNIENNRRAIRRTFRADRVASAITTLKGFVSYRKSKKSQLQAKSSDTTTEKTDDLSSVMGDE